MIPNSALKSPQSTRLNESTSHSHDKPVEETQGDKMAEKSLQDGNRAGKGPQVIAAFVVTIGGFLEGTVIGWYGAIVAQIHHRYGAEHGHLINWIASIVNLGGLLSSFVPVVVLDSLGRKKTMICMLPALLSGWLILAASTNVYACILGRFLTGLGCGAIFVAVPVYICEIAQKDIRSTLGVLFHLQLEIGFLYSSTLGLLDSIPIVSLSCCIPVIVFVFLLKFIPESPIFLLCKGNNEAAAKSLQWLRGNSYNITEELKEMSTLVEESNKRGKSFKAMWKHRAAFCGLVIAMLVLMSQQLSGVNAVRFYSFKVYQFAGAIVSVQITGVLIAVLQVVATLVMTLTIRWIRHRIILVASFTWMGFSLLCMGIYFFVLQRDEAYAKLVFWLPHCSVGVFIIAFCFGAGPLPWLMIGELFPIEAKAIGASITAGSGWFISLMVTSTFKILVENFNMSAIIWIFAEFCLLESVLIFLFVIETKNKTLEEIQKELVEDLEKEE